MPVDFKDNSKGLIAKSKDAGRKAMDATANYLQRQVVKAFGSDYYLGGAFRSTLYVKQSIRRTRPRWTDAGWESEVGTKLIEALYWELGHRNIFKRVNGQPTFQRVRIWEPTALESLPEMRATYARVLKRYLGTGI